MSIKLQILLNFRVNVSCKSIGNHTYWSVRHPEWSFNILPGKDIFGGWPIFFQARCFSSDAKSRDRDVQPSRPRRDIGVLFLQTSLQDQNQLCDFRLISTLYFPRPDVWVGDIWWDPRPRHCALRIETTFHFFILLRLGQDRDIWLSRLRWDRDIPIKHLETISRLRCWLRLHLCLSWCQSNSIKAPKASDVRNCNCYSIFTGYHIACSAKCCISHRKSISVCMSGIMSKWQKPVACSLHCIAQGLLFSVR